MSRTGTHPSESTSSTLGIDQMSGSSKFSSDMKTNDLTAIRGRDLHPEILGSWSEQRLMDLRKKREQRLKRTPMGEYVPSSTTQNVLTTAALPTPSAFDYTPKFKLIFRAVPKLTIGKKLYKRKVDATPGPQDYTIKTDLYNPKNALTLKSRNGFTFLPKENGYPNATAASYALPTTVGKDCAKAVITSRPPQKMNVGMVPSFPYPPPGSLNTAGFYDSPTTVSKGATFGQIPRPLTKDEFPGPIYQVPPKFPEGLSFELKGPSPWPPKIQGYDAPAPNTYLPKSMFGTGDKFPRVTKRLPSVIQGKKIGPSPNTYNLAVERIRPVTMGSIPLPSRFRRQPLPAPNTYTIEKSPVHVKRKKGLKLLVLTKRKTMLTLRHAAVEDERPTSLDLTYFKIEKFGRGKFSASIRSRPKEKKDDKLAPNSYCPCEDLSKPTIPAYTFGRNTIIYTPPATINVPAIPLPSTLRKKNLFTFGAPYKEEIRSDNPSPTRYSIPSKIMCMARKPQPGASFKGRPSPFVHHGIAKLRVAPTATKLRNIQKKVVKRTPMSGSADTT